MPETPKGPKRPAKNIKAAQEAAKAIVKAKVASKAAKAPTPAKTGRPSKYNPEIARIICEQLSEGIPLRQICRENAGFPAWRTVYDWMAKDDALGSAGVGLSASIARARDIGYDAIAEECLQIADNIELGQKQVMTDEGSATTVEDMLGHRKLRIETRLKLLAKFHPTKYGDKLGLHGVEGAAPISTEDATANKFLEVIRNMEMTKRAG
jgi:predicted secreted protein